MNRMELARVLTKQMDRWADCICFNGLLPFAVAAAQIIGEEPHVVVYEVDDERIREALKGQFGGDFNLRWWVGQPACPLCGAGPTVRHAANRTDDNGMSPETKKGGEG